MVILFIVLKFNEKNHIVGLRVAHNDVVFIDNSEDNDAIAWSSLFVDALGDVKVLEAQVDY